MDKVICLGKNYLAHAMELGDAVPENPVLFLKPPSVIIQARNYGEVIKTELPYERGDIHYETEIALKIDSKQKISAFTIGLDMTLRSVQAELKKKGHPWEIGKVFKHSIILGPWIPIENVDYLNTEFKLIIENQIRQKAYGNQMRMKPVESLNYIQKYFELLDDDVIMTGTPEGVGPVLKSEIGELYFGEKLLFKVEF